MLSSSVRLRCFQPKRPHLPRLFPGRIFTSTSVLHSGTLNSFHNRGIITQQRTSTQTIEQRSKWTSEPPEHSPNPFHQPMQLALLEKNAEEVIKLFEEMKKENIRTSVMVVNSMCHLVGVKYPKKMLEIFLHFKEMGLVDKTLYFTAIYALGKAGMIPEMLELMEEVKEMAAPDAGTYAAVIGALGKHGHKEKMWQYCREMYQSRLHTTPKIWNNILAVYADSDIEGMEKALHLFRQLHQPDQFTYSILIEAYCNAGLVDKAQNVLVEMMRHQQESTAAFAQLIKAYLRLGKEDKVQDVIKQMSETELPPNTLFMNTILELFAAKKDISRLKICLDGMIQSGILPDNASFNIYLNALFKESRFQEMYEVFEGMREYCKPNAHNYLLMVQLLQKENKLSQMEQLFLDMLGDGVKLDLYLTNRLLATYSRLGLTHMLEMVLEHAEAQSVKLNIISYNSILAAYAKKGELSRVVEIMERLEQLKVVKDAQTYNTAISAAAHCDNSELMQQYLDEMKQQGHKPDKYTYSIILNQLKKKKMHQAMQSVYNEMKQNGVKPDGVIYRIMGSLILKKEKKQKKEKKETESLHA